MPFSLSSYLLGVGTVVGALAFGFGGGVVLTKTAMKSSPAAVTRVERVARAEPLPSASPQNGDRTGPTPSAPAPISSVPAAADSAESNPVEGRNENDAVKAAELTPSIETPKAAEPSKKSAEPSAKSLEVKEQSGKSVESKEAERQKTIDRKLLRQKAEAERRAREKAKEIAGRAKPRQFEQVEHPDRVFTLRGQEAQPNFFEVEKEPGETTGLVEQSNKSAEQTAKPAEWNEPERRQMVDRKLARQQRDGERKRRETAGTAQQRQFEQVEPSDHRFAFRRQEAQPNFFEVENGPGDTTGLVEQSNKSAEQSAKPAEWKEPERRQMLDRKLTRQPRDADRKRRETAGTAQQRQFEQGDPPNHIFASERQETRPNLFGLPLFGRSLGDED